MPLLVSSTSLAETKTDPKADMVAGDPVEFAAAVQ
jgi:hypothetical protein